MEARLLLLLLLVSIFNPSLALSKEVHLFSNGEQVSNYNTLLSTLAPGDILYFESGDKFEVVNPSLGHGNTTQILHVRILNPVESEPSEVALRIPLRSGEYITEYGMAPYIQYINQTIAALKTIPKYLPAPRQYRAYKNQFVAVDLIGTHVPLAEFLKMPPKKGNANYGKMITSLFDFAKRSAEIRAIGDFHPWQLVYEFDKERWVLDDPGVIEKYTPGDMNHLDNPHIFSRNFQNHVVTHIFNRERPPTYTRNLLIALDRTITNERKRIFAGKFNCKEILTALPKQNPLIPSTLIIGQIGSAK